MMHKLVKRAREKLGLSQQHLADLADVPRSQVQVLEKGGNVTRETLEKVLAAMGMSLAVVSRDDIAAMREALQALDDVLARLAVQVTAPPVFDPRRLLAMSRELEEIVRATQGDAAAAPIAAVIERQAAVIAAEEEISGKSADTPRSRRRARRPDRL